MYNNIITGFLPSDDYYLKCVYRNKLFANLRFQRLQANKSLQLSLTSHCFTEPD